MRNPPMRLFAVMAAGAWLAGLPAGAQEQPAPPPAEQGAVSARSRVLELAGAFANEGYKVRDGFWSGVLEPGKPLFLEINCFAGNEYWVSAAAIAPARKITLATFNGKGEMLAGGETHEDGPTAAAGILPTTSGRYFVRLELTEGEKADFCLVYSYK